MQLTDKGELARSGTFPTECEAHLTKAEELTVRPLGSYDT